MKIAYVIPTNMGFSNFSGIKVQADVWADELIRKGHKVDRINPWECHDLASYDVVHIFSCFYGIYRTVQAIYKYNKNIYLSPIIDSNKNKLAFKLATYMGFSRLRLYSYYWEVRQCVPYIKCWLARSNFEAGYIKYCYSVPGAKVAVVPLSYRTGQCDSFPEKEKFCLHVSLLVDERKNVMRLMQAAIKYKFKLVLAGSCRSDKDFAPFKEVIDTHDNITYLGRVSDEELVSLYKRAKVFALPSTFEGVGMVAVEAASYGCDIVVTNIGGPKEYYADMSTHVNPYDVDDIGKAVLKALDDTTSQPQLQYYVQKHFNLSACVDQLINTYKS